MAGEVGQLTVNLGLNAAGFSGGITEAGKAARKAGQDIKQGMEEGKYSMMEARHSVMMLAESFGIHIPRGISTMIASVGPVGTLLAAAFPFAAIALGATLVFKEIAKCREEAVKLADAESEFKTKGAEAFENLAEKINQARIKSDELSGDLKDKLSREIDSINHATLKDIATQFESFDKEATAVFEHLKGHWYTFGSGSAGATASLDKIKNKYEELLHMNDGGAAAGSFLESQLKRERGLYDDMVNQRAQGLSVDDKEFDAQEKLTNTLFRQVQYVKDRKVLEAQDVENKNKEDEKKTVQEAMAVLKARADGDIAHLNALHQASKEEEAARNAQTMKTGLPEEKEQVSFASADSEFEHASQLANKKMALAKLVYDNDVYAAGEDAQKKEEADVKYANAVKAHQGELTAALMNFNKQRAVAVASANAETDKLNQKALDLVLKNIAVEDAARKKEASEEIAVAKEAAAGEKEVDEANAAQQAERIKIMESQYRISKRAALQADIDADKEALAAKIASISAESEAQQAAIQKQIAANKAAAAAQSATGVSQGDPKFHDYLSENVELEQKLGSTGVKAQADIAAATIRTDTSLMKLNADVKQTENSWGAWARLATQDVSSLGQAVAVMSKTMQGELDTALKGFSNSLAKTAVEGKSLGTAMKNVAKEMAESFISAATQMLVKYIMLKLGMGAVDKSAAATSAIAAVTADKVKVASAAGVAGAQGVASFAGAPWPIDMGAPAFGADMAMSALGFGAAEQGGLVGYDDMIIAAHKNEMVLPAPLSQKVQNMTDDKKGGTTVHVHYSPTVHAIDGKGIGQVLNEHSSVIQAHVQKALRRTNKG